MTPQEIKTKLQSAYPDGQVEVVDMTGTHDHYQVQIASAAFQGKTRIQAHKDVMAVFDSELKSGEVHALMIKTIAK